MGRQLYPTACKAHVRLPATQERNLEAEGEGFEPLTDVTARNARATYVMCERPRPLRAGRLVLHLLSLAKGIHRFVDGQEDCRFERAKRAAATNRQRNRGHGHVVGSLP